MLRAQDIDVNPQTADLLYLMAEVSIATAALSGITMMISLSGRKVSAERVTQALIQLRAAVFITGLSMLPLMLDQMGLDGATLWRVSSGLYLVVLAFIAIAFRPPEMSDFQPGLRVLGIATVLTALLLNSLNLWLHTSWPYMLQLFIGWILSISLFLAFVYDVLSEEST